jgi:alkylglycerol monooxygenase
MEKAPNFIALAIPFFFLLIGLELLIAYLQKKQIYRLNDAITDLSCGITSQVWAVFVAVSLASVYLWIFDHYRIYTFSKGSWWPWLIAFVLVDFLYYWWHRLSHEVNFLWAAHIVHHQSEDYNLAVALRQAITTSLTTLPFYLPLAFLGIPPVVYFVIVQFSTLYQFWIHTQLIKTIGPLEALLNTPAHHRVHHAVNPKYLDKNYAATLILWDKLFGTFEPETEPPVYGLVKPLKSFDPMWSQFHYWFDMAHLAQRATHWSDKLQVLFRSPAWSPRNLPLLPPPEVSPKTFVKFNPQISRGRAWYIFLNFVLVLGGAAAFIFLGAKLSFLLRLSVAALIVLSLWAWGGIFENKTWGLALEALRLLLALILLVNWLV